MNRHSIGVYSNDVALAKALSARTSAFAFHDGAGRENCRIVVLDGDAAAIDADVSPRKGIVRIILDSPQHVRRYGEIRLERADFLARAEEVLSFAADLADTAIHAAELEQEVSYLTQIQELIAVVDARDVSERITRTVLNILGLRHGTLFLHDPRLERYAISFSNDEGVRETGEYLPGMPPDLLQKALSSPHLLATQRDGNGNGMILMPLQVQEDLIGIIKIPLTGNDPFDDETATSVSRYLKAVTHVLSNVYQLTRSRDLALRDDLTKAFNRRFFEAYLDEEIARCRRYGALFSIIFLDLDDLKMINSFYGHLAGSRTLQEVAKRILGAIRGIDKAVRFGGDEFCIILPQTDQEQAVAVANRVRRSISGSIFMLEPNIEISISASFGIATYPTHALTKEGLVRQADAAMYRVKSTTKNAVGLASVEDATRPVV